MDSGVHWLKRGGKTPLHIALSVIALAVGVGAMLFLRKNDEKRIDSVKEPVVRSVSLVNRTITAASKEGSVPTVPEMPAHLSRRGTASFMVVSREKATLPVRRRVESCGAMRARGGALRDSRVRNGRRLRKGGPSRARYRAEALL